MPNENLTKFAEAAVADPALQKKIQTVHAQAAAEAATKIAALSAEAGTPFTALEFLEASQVQSASLSDTDLEKVAGGWWRPDPGNFVVSIATLGLGCAGLAAYSLIANGNIDKCQPSDK